MIEFLRQPMPWYIAGPLIGLTVPLLLILGNKTFGISSSLRHICAMCIPANIPFFQYEWKKEIWNILFVVGIGIGGALATTYLSNSHPIDIHPNLQKELSSYGVTNLDQIIPKDFLSLDFILSGKGFFFYVVGGFLVGFGTRYAGGCTSGHAIMGLSNLQFPSLVATLFFMLGGFIMANFILPIIFKSL